MPSNRERPHDTLAGSTLRGLGGLFNLLGEMLETGQREVSRSGEVRNLGGAMGVHAEYAYSVRTLTDHKPTHQSSADLRQSTYREPLLDTFEEQNSLKVLIELPGVEIDDVRVAATETTLTISVEAPRLRHDRKVPLPAHVKPETVKVRLNNGVLEVQVEKAEPQPRPAMDQDAE